MTPRRINLALKSLAAALVVSAGISLAAALLLPLDEATSVDSASSRAMPTTNPASTRSLESFARAWTAPLRQSLDDLPPSPDRPTLASQNPTGGVANAGPVALVGTIGESLAMLRTPDGTVSLKAVGESAAGVEIVAIRPSEVDVRVNGLLTTLRKPADAGAATSPTAGGQNEGAPAGQDAQ